MAEEKKKRFTKRSLPAPVRLAVEAALARKAEELCRPRPEGAFLVHRLFHRHQRELRPGRTCAIAEAIEAALKPAGSRPIGIEGRESAEWVLLDYGSFVIHVFSKAARDHYALEKLWGDAPRLDFLTAPVLRPAAAGKRGLTSRYRIAIVLGRFRRCA